MTQGGECLGNIVRHGNINVTGSIVPVELEAKIAGPGPILGKGVFGGQGSKEMIGVGFGKYLMPKLSTARVKVVQQVLCCQKLGVWVTG